MQQSKNHQSFLSKIKVLRQHVQLSDLCYTQGNVLCAKKKDEEISIADALKAKEGSHMQLRMHNDGRNIGMVFANSRAMINQQAIVDLYSSFAEYLSSIVASITKVSPYTIRPILEGKEEYSIKFHDLVKLGNYDSIMSEMARRVFRILEDERSSKQLLNKLIKLTNISISGELIERSLLFMELRHLIIHNEAKADDKFINANRENIVTINSSNKKISYTFPLTESAINCISDLCTQIDSELIRKGLLSAN